MDARATLRNVLDRRLCDLIIGTIAMQYGWSALHTPRESFQSSFQILLMLEGHSTEIGAGFFIGGLAVILTSVSRFWLLRVISHALLLFLWLTIVMAFLLYKEPGIPFGNGVILALSSLLIILGIIVDEKHFRSSCLN